MFDVIRLFRAVLGPFGDKIQFNTKCVNTFIVIVFCFIIEEEKNIRSVCAGSSELQSDFINRLLEKDALQDLTSMCSCSRYKARLFLKTL